MSLVAVVIPTYNRPDYLHRLLLSVKNQTFADIDVIVVDDNSPNTTGYAEVVDHFSSELRLTYVRNDTNRGAQFCRNRGVALADSEYVALVDDDDEWLPGKVHKQVALFETLPERAGLVYAWADSVDESGEVVYRYRASHRGNDLRVLLRSCFIPSPTVMVRRAVFKDLVFDQGQLSCQDWDMWTRMVEAGYSYDVVEETLAIYHKHQRPSIGQSPKSLQGFARYYSKHEKYYCELGMGRELSEKLRGLASEMAVSGMADDAYQCLRRSVQLWPLNWKGWIRLLQARAATSK